MTKHVPSPICDVTEISSLAICPVRRCGWRTLQLSEDMARLRYAEHYEAKHRATTLATTQCRHCGTAKVDLPRRGICSACHHVERAAKARRDYAARGRADRRSA